MEKGANSNNGCLPDLQNDDDIGRIARYRQSGDSSIISSLMQKYSAQIVAFSMEHFRNREDARDFANDVFLKLCDKLLREEIVNFRSWLYVFMKNMFYDMKRKEQLHMNFVNRSQQLEQHHSIEKKLIGELDKARLYGALEVLSENERKCIQLLYIEGKNYNEIMRETGWTFNQIRGMRDRATKRLRETISLEFKE